MTGSIIQADLTWTGRRFETNLKVQVDEEGRIVAVGDLDAEVTLRLERRALLPGFVNAHSHAFQRGLRGQGERFQDRAGSFWSWREAMYGLVSSMDAERLHALCVQAFDEMRRSGVTTVGEFHYLHHDRTEDGFAFDEVVLAAARAVGIRIVLLNAYYNTGDINTPLSGGQRRFAVGSTEAYWAQMDRLTTSLGPNATLGVVAHSIRAAGIDDIVALYTEASRRHLVFHMHVEEQPREIEACLEHYHQTPLALLNDRLEIGPRFTAVHCTHTALRDMDSFLEAGGNVCLCPLTEANLGDGIADVPYIVRRSGRVCVGTDSNARLCLLEELRWLEYVQRLRTMTRGVVVDANGEVAAALLAIATMGGARALGLRVGAIRPGYEADFVAIDLDHAGLEGWRQETLAESIVFGAGNGVVARTCVGGEWTARV